MARPQVGDRVYHTGVRANGFVEEIDDTKTRDKYKVRFYWGKYCDIRHGRWTDRPERGDKWQWCEEKYLVVTDWYHRSLILNKITSIGGRSLDRLIRRVCEIGRRKRNDGSDVVISYGQGNHRVPERVFMLNRGTILDKHFQCKLMGDMAPECSLAYPDKPEEWIIKPCVSMGGKNIRTIENGDVARGGEYYQKRFNKVREFRVHCFLWLDNPVPFIQEKIIDDKNQLCWNKKQGGRFWYIYQEGLDLPHQDKLSLANRNIMTKMAVEALKKLRYDFGGIDFGMDANGKFTIFEVNSRMGLLEQSLYTYKKVFHALRTLNIAGYRRERWQNAG